MLFPFTIIGIDTDFVMCVFIVFGLKWRIHLLSAHKLYFGIILLKSSVTTDPPCAAVVGFILIFSCQCSFCRLSLRWSHRTDSISDIAACCSLYLLYPSRPGVAGGLQVVRGSRPASFSCVFFFFFCQTTAFNSGWLWMQGHSRLDGGLLSESCRAPLFLYYHKQIRGSGEHTQMQIAAERPISTLHYNGPSCMCRLSQPIKHKMNLM